MATDEHLTDGVGPPSEDPDRWELLDVQPQPASVVRVRREVRAVLTRWNAHDMEWVASQLLTEVVTNALLHAGTPFDVVLVHSPGTVRCEVRDHSPLRPRTRNFSPEASTGRGMQLVDRLATAWGVLPDPDGKTVWFELSPSPDVDPDGDGEPDLDALLDSFDDPDVDRGPPDTVHPPHTDIACNPLLPGESTRAGDRRRLGAAS